MIVTEQTRVEGSIKTDTVEIEVPESCIHCGFKNMKIYGVRTNGRTVAEVRCMRCGKQLFKTENDERV